MDSNELLVGQVLSERYRIDGQIAVGGMAYVYRAYDLRLERNVALKVVKEEFALEENYLDAFLREARLAAKVNHPNLVNVYDQGIDGGSEYLVMELVEGKTLREVLTRFGSIDQTKALNVISSILGGLSALHAAGIVHRDIKPENVILANDGRVKLTDFGLAQPSSLLRDRSEPLLGTLAYIAPEVLRGEVTDSRSDVYSIGITLFELVAGRQPFQSSDARELARKQLSEPMPIPSDHAQVSKAFDELVLKATEKDPLKRFRDARELLAAVRLLTEPAQSSNPTTVIAATERIENATELIDQDFDVEMEEPKKRKRSKVLTWLTASVLAVTLGLGAGWWFGTGPGALITVPDLVSMSESEARSAVELLPIKLETADENSDEPVGTVIRTDPPAGGLIVRDGTLSVVLSIGPKLNTVPDLTGKNLIEATAALREADFWIGKTESWFHDSPAGTVYEYSGSDGASFPAGSSVDIKISLGPLPVVAGVDRRVAETLLTAAGLKVGVVSQVFSDTVAKGQVVSLVPKTAEVGAGSIVDLQVSKGTDKVVMPAVIGETIAAGKLALEQLGLKVIVDTNVLSSRWGVAKIKQASAAAGTELRLGNTVTIISR